MGIGAVSAGVFSLVWMFLYVGYYVFVPSMFCSG